MINMLEHPDVVFTTRETLEQIEVVIEAIVGKTSWQCTAYALDELIHCCPRHSEAFKEAMKLFLENDDLGTYKVLNQIKKEVM